jgi:predicted AAA+ superfamily ATPase
LYIDLRHPETKEWFDKINGSSSWQERFIQFAQETNAPVPINTNNDFLVILDELQESPRMFNSIRDIVRERKIRLAVTGSYLGITEFENRYSAQGQSYFMPVGDVEVFVMGSLSYKEAVKAAKTTIPELSKNEIFQRYFNYGGYPEVVKKWLQTEQWEAVKIPIDNIYKMLEAEARRYISEPLTQQTWDRMFISVAQQIIKKGDILQSAEFSEEITYKLRVPSMEGSHREAKINMMSWMLSCDLLWFGEVTYNLSNLADINKKNYFVSDQGLLYLALNNSLSLSSMPLSKGNMSGVLAENFVALGIREYRVPLSYAKKSSEEIDFLLKEAEDVKPDAIEVKFTGGVTASSDNALKTGLIRRIIKIQRETEQSTDKVIIFPMMDMDDFGSLYGCDYEYNRYTRPALNLFSDG